MYSVLDDLNRKPEPFSRYTTDTLWTDPWIARKMLENHLNQGTDMASRRAQTIDDTVEWFDRKIGLSGKAVCDLGCGPGLYATRMAEKGARVTGVDFSAVSLAHAQSEAAVKKLDIDYWKADYLVDDLPCNQNIVTLIYCDFCALAPEKRHLLLKKIKKILTKDGILIFDVSTTVQYEKRQECEIYGRRLMGRFWSPEDHFCFQTTFLYHEEKISLDRYLIVAPQRQFEIFNWVQYFNPKTITAEVAQAGLVVEEILAITTGDPWTPDAGELAVLTHA